jgi:hypothetical protein
MDGRRWMEGAKRMDIDGQMFVDGHQWMEGLDGWTDIHKHLWTNVGGWKGPNGWMIVHKRQTKLQWMLNRTRTNVECNGDGRWTE